MIAGAATFRIQLSTEWLMALAGMVALALVEGIYALRTTGRERTFAIARMGFTLGFLLLAYPVSLGVDTLFRLFGWGGQRHLFEPSRWFMLGLMMVYFMPWAMDRLQHHQKERRLK